MVEFIKFVFVIIILYLLWKFLRNIAIFIESVISLKENQKDMQDLLEEIRDELKKINKFNEDSKNSNY